MGLGRRTKIRNRPALIGRGTGRVDTGRSEGMIMRVCRREVFCERGWGVSLRSTTCKGMVTVPGGELRCTGNLCSERPLRLEAERLFDHKPLAKHRRAFFSRDKRKKKKEIWKIEHGQPNFPHATNAILSSSAPWQFTLLSIL